MPEATQKYSVDPKRVESAQRYMKEKVDPVIEELVVDRQCIDWSLTLPLISPWLHTDILLHSQHVRCSDGI